MRNVNMKKGVATLALVAALGLGGGMLTSNAAMAASEDHSSSAGQAVSDGWITTKIKTELATTKGVQSTDVSVTTVDGKVTLTGVLPSKLEEKKVVAVAKSVKGVKDVDSSGLRTK
ncbi:MAG TPA: BON domain-containing protein [Nevskiaceae bacterium]